MVLRSDGFLYEYSSDFGFRKMALFLQCEHSVLSSLKKDELRESLDLKQQQKFAISCGKVELKVRSKFCSHSENGSMLHELVQRSVIFEFV
jgi:hypothetical protein